MPDRDESLPAFLQRLRKLKVSGDAARAQIADRLATMTVEELRRVPPWVITRLGPKGLTLLAERSRVLRTARAGSPQPIETSPASVPKPKPRSSWIADLKRRRPLWLQSAKSTMIAIAIGLGVLAAFPFVQRAIHMVTVPALCSQLDRWTGGCIYRTGTDYLTLSNVANYLELPVATLLSANPTFNPNRPLPRGTYVVVPRREGINLR